MIVKSYLKSLQNGFNFVRQEIQCNFHTNRCSVSKIHRNKYCRLYDTYFVFTDGSALKLRYHEPRAIINLPIAFEDLTSEEEKKLWQTRRRKIEKFKLEKDDAEVNLDKKKYLKHFKI